MVDPREPRFDGIAVALAELRVRLEQLIAEARLARRRSLELRADALRARKPRPPTRARIRGRGEYELVQVTDDGLWVLADGTGRLQSFDGASPVDRPEVRCDVCGRWTAYAAPVRRGLWATWQCAGGCAPQSDLAGAGAGRKGSGPTGA